MAPASAGWCRARIQAGSPAQQSLEKVTSAERDLISELVVREEGPPRGHWCFFRVQRNPRLLWAACAPTPGRSAGNRPRYGSTRCIPPTGSVYNLHGSLTGYNEFSASVHTSGLWTHASSSKLSQARPDPGASGRDALPLIMGAGRKLISLSEPRRLFSK